MGKEAKEAEELELVGRLQNLHTIIEEYGQSGNEEKLIKKEQLINDLQGKEHDIHSFLIELSMLGDVIKEEKKRYITIKISMNVIF